MRKIVTLGVVLLAVLLAAPAWSQEAEPEGPQFLGELVALMQQYARDEGGPIGPQAQAQIANQVRITAGQMLALGYTERQITRAALQGLREALVQLQTRTQTQEAWDQGLGELLRLRLQDQVHLAECDQTPDRLQTRDWDRLRTGTGPLVAGPPVGAGGPGGGGRP